MFHEKIHTRSAKKWLHQLERDDFWHNKKKIFIFISKYDETKEVTCALFCGRTSYCYFSKRELRRGLDWPQYLFWNLIFRGLQAGNGRLEAGRGDPRIHGTWGVGGSDDGWRKAALAVRSCSTRAELYEVYAWAREVLRLFSFRGKGAVANHVIL